jgi:hypothetical protein
MFWTSDSVSRIFLPLREVSPQHIAQRWHSKETFFGALRFIFLN